MLYEQEDFQGGNYENQSFSWVESKPLKNAVVNDWTGLDFVVTMCENEGGRGESAKLVKSGLSFEVLHADHLLKKKRNW